MATSLKAHFPMIRDREEVLNEINSQEKLYTIFHTWTEEQQNEFLDICTGVLGLKLLSDSFFKEIINPEISPERLEEILFLILKTKVKILKVLPNDSTRIAAENSLLILDIVVQLEDNSIANIEMQRIGYAFPGQRCACYSADLLLRQYKRVKGEKGKKFSYRDIKKVYTIIFFERSTNEFHKYPNNHIHYMKQTSDTGIEIDLLQEYVFIALDIFQKRLHNKEVDINNKLEAWLTFFSVDDPDWILKLIELYPEFERLYNEVYEMCRNLEAMMENFSKELAELDKNTVEYMIDEMQETIDVQREQISQQKEQLSQKEEQLLQKDSAIEEMKKRMEEMEKLLESRGI